jgi:hypothetical protein
MHFDVTFNKAVKVTVCYNIIVLLHVCNKCHKLVPVYAIAWTTHLLCNMHLYLAYSPCVCTCTITFMYKHVRIVEYT